MGGLVVAFQDLIQTLPDLIHLPQLFITQLIRATLNGEAIGCISPGNNSGTCKKRCPSVALNFDFFHDSPRSIYIRELHLAPHLNNLAAGIIICQWAGINNFGRERWAIKSPSRGGVVSIGIALLCISFRSRSLRSPIRLQCTPIAPALRL